MTTYEVRIADPFGVPLAVVRNFVDNPDGGGSALDYALSVGGVGVLSLTLPATFDASLLRLDGRIGVWRGVGGRAPALDGQAVFLIRRWDYTAETTTVTAYHATSLLQRRIVAYYAGTAYSAKAAAAADNQIKAFVRENLGASISAANRIGAETQADLSAYLAVQADLGDGASLAAQDAYANLYDLVRDLADTSTEDGTYLTAEIVAPTESTLELRTYTGLRGVDHRAGTGNPVILSPEAGSLANARFTIDRSQEATVVIAAGSGEGTARTTATAIDTLRMGDSPLNRIEVFGDYTNIADAGALAAKADALLRQGRPQIEFAADVVETDGATRGVHYDLGDLVTALFRGQLYDCRLDVIGVTVGGGQQTSRARVRYVG